MQTRILHKGQHAHIAWVLDDKFHLFRMLCETRGVGGVWANKDGSVPVCGGGEVFGPVGEWSEAGGGAEEGKPFLRQRESGPVQEKERREANVREL